MISGPSESIVTFPKPFSNTNYIALVSLNGGYGCKVGIYNKSTTTLTIDEDGGVNILGSWYAAGY